MKNQFISAWNAFSKISRERKKTIQEPTCRAVEWKTLKPNIYFVNDNHKAESSQTKPLQRKYLNSWTFYFAVYPSLDKEAIPDGHHSPKKVLICTSILTIENFTICSLRAIHGNMKNNWGRTIMSRYHHWNVLFHSFLESVRGISYILGWLQHTQPMTIYLQTLQVFHLWHDRQNILTLVLHW